MDAKDLMVGTLYRYEGSCVRLVTTRVFHGPEGERIMAIIDTGIYARLWVKPEELAPCDDLLKEIDTC